MTTNQTDPAAGDAQQTSAPASSVAEGGAELAQADFARDAGATNLGEYVRDYISRVRGGEVGAIPAVLGLIVLGGIFSSLSDNFLTVSNLANLVIQAGPTILIAMGLVFVLLLGEIDLAAGTASGVCAALMALSLIQKGDLHKALGGTVFYIVVLFMVAAIATAVISRLWWATGIVAVGLLAVLTGIGITQSLGGIFVAVAVGTSIGMLTGLLVSRVGIPSFVVTLALFLGWQGVLLQFIGNGAALSTSRFDLLAKISNGYLNPTLSWILFAVALIGYTAYAVLRSSRRRAEGLSSEPLPAVVLKVVAVGVIAGVVLFFLNKERGPNPSVVSIKGSPYILPIVLVLMVFWTFVLTKTRFGRYVYSVGGNAEAARRAGIDLRRIRTACFAIGSGMAALGGVAQASYTGGVPSDAGGGNTLLYAVAAAVIGGTSLFGGRGRARDAVIGGLVIAMIPNGLGLLRNHPASLDFIITMLVLLLAASVDAVSRKVAAAR